MRRLPLSVPIHLEAAAEIHHREHKDSFLISLLTGKVLSWAKAICNANSMPTINSYEAFINHFKEVFGSATGMLSVSDQLLRLRQGISSTSDYALHFRTLATTSGWNEAALVSACRQGLDPRIRAQMAGCSCPCSWIPLISRMLNGLAALQQDSAYTVLHRITSSTAALLDPHAQW